MGSFLGDGLDGVVGVIWVDGAVIVIGVVGVDGVVGMVGLVKVVGVVVGIIELRGPKKKNNYTSLLLTGLLTDVSR